MPKRKREHSDSRSYIKEKIRKLERKLLKGRRRRLSSSSDSVHWSDEPQADAINEQENVENVIDDDLIEVEPEPSASASDFLQVPIATPEPSTSASDFLQVPIATDSVSEPTFLKENEQAPPITGLPEQQAPELDEIALEILGADPSNAVTFGKDIQKDLAVRFEFIATSGLTTERRKELLASHLPPGNCKLIDAPSLNPEIKAAINDNMIKRDKAMQLKQKQVGNAIACLGEAISIILSKDTKDPVLLKLLMDTGRILCDSQYNTSVTRRNFIMAILKKELKDQIQSTKIDTLLFGRELSETLKAAKAINKSGSELKVAAPPRSYTNTNKTKPAPFKNNLNWKAPGPSRRPTGPPRAKESAPPTRQPPATSSRPSRGRPSAARGRQ